MAMNSVEDSIASNRSRALPLDCEFDGLRLLEATPLMGSSPARSIGPL